MATLVDIRDCRVSCTVTGSGPALLLVHGAEGDHHMFHALVKHLAQDFTVIAYDQRDCGETRNPERPTSLRELAQDAQDLLAALGYDRAHVYGTSFGGRVAQALAHLAPGAIDKLVLGSTWPLPSALAGLNGPAVQHIGVLRARLPDSAEELAGYFFPPDFLEARPEFKNIFRTARPHTDRSVRRQQAVSECPALEPEDLRIPTLLIAGEIDRVVPPAQTRAMEHAIPGARAVFLPGVGHAAALQAPDLVAMHIRAFCNRAGATATQA